MLKLLKEKPKRRQCNLLMKHIFTLISQLEDSLEKAEKSDREILLVEGVNRLKYQSIHLQLEGTKKENKYLLDMLQFGDTDTNVSRTNSFSSCSTMSLVHLQYKYDELSIKYNGLLKILEMRLSEIKKIYKENEKLKEEIQSLKINSGNYQDEITVLMRKIKEIRNKKKMKIIKLRKERNTLRLVHNNLVALLNKQCMEIDHVIAEKIKHSCNSDEALLLQEIRKNNLLSYENFYLQQEIEYLQSILPVKNRSQESLSSNCKCKSIKN